MDDISPANLEPGVVSEDSESGQDSSAKKVCSACRTVNEPSSVYCYKCGTRLPEEIQFDIKAGGSTAGFLSRFTAGFVDQVLLVTVGFIILWILERLLPGDVMGFNYTIYGWSYYDDWTRMWWILGILLVTEVIYFTVAIGTWGRTFGKIVLGLRVVREDGSRVSYAHSLARCLIYLIQLGLSLGFTFFVIAFNPEKRAIHDMICDTKVVTI